MSSGDLIVLLVVAAARDLLEAPRSRSSWPSRSVVDTPVMQAGDGGRAGVSEMPPES